MEYLDILFSMAQSILCIEAWKVYVLGNICFVLYLLITYLFTLPKVSNIKGKSILITGCDTGFGRALAIRLEELGCQVFAGCLTPEGVTSLKEKCSIRLIPVQMDVTDNIQIEAAHRHVLTHLPYGKGMYLHTIKNIV